MIYDDRNLVHRDGRDGITVQSRRLRRKARKVVDLERVPVEYDGKR